jgi:hypothetical protein
MSTDQTLDLLSGESPQTASYAPRPMVQSAGFGAIPIPPSGPTTSTFTAPLTSGIPSTPIRNTMPDATPLGRHRSGSTHIEGMESLSLASATQKEENEQISEGERQMKQEELSFYSSADNEHGDDNIWGLLSGVAGDIYEW